MKYFAYGSNMLLERLRERVPSAIIHKKAKLQGYTLTWCKTGKDGSGKCSIVNTSKEQDYVWGVLYEIDSAEKINLDRIEGLGYGYDETIIQLEFNKEIIKAVTYIATNINPCLKPYRWYKDFVIQGARQNKLSKNYIALLKTAECISDPDKKRLQNNRNILNKS